MEFRFRKKAKCSYKSANSCFLNTIKFKTYKLVNQDNQSSFLQFVLSANVIYRKSLFSKIKFRKLFTKMGRPKTVLSDRVNQFATDGLYLSDTNVVMCKYCNTRLEGDKKDTLQKHVKSANHMNKKNPIASTSGTKRQMSITSGFERQKRAKQENDTFVEDTVNMCLKANIPLHKLDHPAVREYIAKYVPGSGTLPCGDTLRRKVVPLCGLSEKAMTKQQLKDKPIVIVADETSDGQGRCVFAILFRTIDSVLLQECFLASVNFLDTANASTCSQAIVDTLKDFEIDYSQVKGLVSDSARYMTACFNLLKILIGPHILHYQCWAHKVNLVGDVFIGEFKELNMFTAKVKSAFCLSRKMKNSYLNYLKENVPDLPAKLYPAPVVTRWNSWFSAVSYLSEYLNHILNFFDVWENENSSIKFLKENYADETFRRKLEIQMVFTTEFCPKLMKLIDDLEGSTYPFAHLLWNKLEDLKSSLEHHRQGYFDVKTSSLLNDHEEIESQTLKNMLIKANEKGFNKLTLHMSLKDTNEAFLHIGQLFNPSIAASFTMNPSVLSESFSKIPFFRTGKQSDYIDGYTHFHRLILQSIQRNEDPNVKDILLATQCCFPSFAKAALQSIWSPTNSVDAERFFSKYNIVVTDRRTALKESNVEITTMLAFNQ